LSLTLPLTHRERCTLPYIHIHAHLAYLSPTTTIAIATTEPSCVLSLMQPVCVSRYVCGWVGCGWGAAFDLTLSWPAKSGSSIGTANKEKTFAWLDQPHAYKDAAVILRRYVQGDRSPWHTHSHSHKEREKEMLISKTHGHLHSCTKRERERLILAPKMHIHIPVYTYVCIHKRHHMFAYVVTDTLLLLPSPCCRAHTDGWGVRVT
jgi:hypothetical protein